MTPYETFLQNYQWPDEVAAGVKFVPHPLQIGTINTLAPHPTHGEWLAMGVGKTMVATAIACIRKQWFKSRTIVILPPSLVLQWVRWLGKVIDKATGKPLKAIGYRGSPKERELLRAQFPSADFVVVGAQIFRKEIDFFRAEFKADPLQVIIDEATLIAWIGTKLHDAVFDYTRGVDVMVLTGTPAGKPLKAYGLCKFTNPDAYPSYAFFKTQHVTEFDQYQQPVDFKHLDVLQQNLMLNSVRLLFSDMYKGDEEPLFDACYYELAGHHESLYKRVAEEKILELVNGDKFDATTPGKLNHMLNQIICNWEHFNPDPSKPVRSAILDQIEDVMDEVPKLVIFAHYKMTVAALGRELAKYGAVTYNSETTGKQKDAAKDRFISDPSCRIIIIQYKSGGYGLDGMQYVCHNIMCVESCRDPDTFAQAIARLKRTGQKNRVHVKLMIASGTTQVRSFKALLTNDDIACQTIRNPYQLRDMIYGRVKGL